MITPYLEQLIHQGKARPRTWNIGAAGVSRIPVAKGTYIVITSVLWNPFIDERLIVNPTIIDVINSVSARSAHTLLLYSRKTKHALNFRDQLNIMTPPNYDVDGICAYATSRPYSIDTYFLFDENVRVNIMNVDNVPYTWTNADYSTMPDSSDELNLAEGYQAASGPTPMQTLKNAQWVWFNANDSALQPNAEQTPLPAVTKANTNYQYLGKGTGRGLINPTALTAHETSGIMTPLVTFQYIEIMQPVPKETIPALS